MSRRCRAYSIVGDTVVGVLNDGRCRLRNRWTPTDATELNSGTVLVEPNSCLTVRQALKKMANGIPVADPIPLRKTDATFAEITPDVKNGFGLTEAFAMKKSVDAQFASYKASKAESEAALKKSNESRLRAENRILRSKLRNLPTDPGKSTREEK